MTNPSITEPIGAENSERDPRVSNPMSLGDSAASERYVMGDEIAQGGIGRIHRATDTRLERPVALKELLDPNPEHETRFLREALVTARLQHPAIVPVYDIGRRPNGEIFYAMKLVSGRSLGEVIDETGSFDKRLALLPHVIAVAEAIAYAHSESIVHRDLKPGNVLIGPFGETVVIDWGIAKDLKEAETPQAMTPAMDKDEPPNSASALTMAGSVLGTPGYMPPEQAAGDPVDERADVYALGAILYHVLAGVAPYEGKSGLDVITKVLTEPPLPLSKRERGVPKDLLAIVSKAMARNPAERYPTAQEFASDLRLFQTGQIVGAYNYSRPERVWRFMQRHRAVVATIGAGLIVTGIIASTSLARVFEARRMAEFERDRANDERVRAQQKQSEAESARKKATQQTDELILIEARAAARHDPNSTITWLSSLSHDFNRWGEARLIAADAQEYGIAIVLDNHTAAINMVAYSPDGKTIATTSDDKTLGIWNADGTLARKLQGHTDEVWRVFYSHDSKRVLSSSKDGTARIWDVETGKNLHTIQAGGPEVEWAEFVGGEKHVALMNCSKRRVELHDLERGTFESMPGQIRCPGSLQVSSDAQYVVYAGDGHARMMDLKTKTHRDYTNTSGKCDYVYLPPDNRHVACSGEGGFVSLWETESGKIRESVPAKRSPTYGAARFARDNRHFLMSNHATLRVVDLETGVSQTLKEHRGPIFSGFFSADSRKVVTTSFDRTTVVFDLDKKTQQPHFGFRDTTCWADFSPDQKSLVVVSWDYTGRIFPVDKSRNRTILQGTSPIRGMRLTQDGQSLVSLQENGIARIEALDKDNDSLRSQKLDGHAHVLSADGSKVAFVAKNGGIRVHSLQEQTEDSQFEPFDDLPSRLYFSPSGNRLLAIGTNKSVRILDLTTREVRSLTTSKSQLNSVAFAEDESLLAIGDVAGTVRVFSMKPGSDRTLEGHVGPVESLVFLPDNARLVSGGKDHTLRIWNLSTGNARVIDASGLGITQIIVSTDGNTLYTLGGESSIRRWNAETGAALPLLRGHHATVVQVELAPEGKRLLSADADGEIRLWDLTTGQGRQFDGHEGLVTRLFFSAKGDRFVSAGIDGAIRLWYDDLPFDGPGLRSWMAKLMPTLMDVAPPAD